MHVSSLLLYLTHGKSSLYLYVLFDKGPRVIDLVDPLQTFTTLMDGLGPSFKNVLFYYCCFPLYIFILFSTGLE